MDTTTLRSLRDGIAGDVVLPDDGAYARLRTTFVHTGDPAVIVRCRTPVDVGCAIGYARANDLDVAVRSGGHSGAGFGTNDGGVVVDLSPMDHVTIADRAAGLVRLGTGARWAGVAAALTPHGLAISSGDTTSVGVGGLMLGGGIGWMVRRYGLAIDSMVAADVVTADGRVLRASAEEHAELFWALRGGGGNFGVVTTFEVAARPVTGVHFGTIAYPAATAAQVLRGWRDAMRTAPDELTSTARMFPSFGGPVPPLIIAVCYAGDDRRAADRAIAPLLDLGTQIERDIAAMPYADVLEDPSDLPPTWQPLVRNRFARCIGDDLIAAVTAPRGRLDKMYVELRQLGGAFARVPRDATAFAHRASEVMVTTALLGSPDDHRQVTSELRGFWDTLAPLVAGAYGNFLSTADPEDVAAMYPADTYARLAAVKRTYDPHNVFRRNHNVAPAGAAA